MSTVVMNTLSTFSRFQVLHKLRRELQPALVVTPGLENSQRRFHR